MAKANLYAMAVGVKAYMTANLPAQLRLIEAELADGVKLPNPATHSLGIADLLANTAARPLVCYVLTVVEHDPQIMAEWRTVSLDILVDLVNSQADSLELVLLRYADAVSNLIAADRSIGGACNLSWISDMKLGHPGGDDKGKAVLITTVQMQQEVLD